MKRSIPGAAALLVLTLAGCQDQPTAVAPPLPDATLAEVSCTVDVDAASLSCEGTPASAGGARHSQLTVGGQNRFVRLTNFGTTMDTLTGVFTTTVTVQNLLALAMGTGDGTTPHPSGVRVFFASGPTNGAAVANATGQDVFLGSSQEYFQYSGPELGIDSILSPDETSSGKPWQFQTNGASSFSFRVYVQAEVPDGNAFAARFTSVVVGLAHTCALTEEGTAYCWGRDLSGQLGNGTTVTGDQLVPSPVEMPAGVRFTALSATALKTCALDTAGQAYCWGHGYLGYGPTRINAQPTPAPVEMPAGVTFTSISVGSEHSCAIGSNGVAYCWGYDRLGVLGNGGPAFEVKPTPTAVQMPAGVTFARISTGFNQTCALTSDGRGYCWGSDAQGQLGNGGWQGDQHAPFAVTMPTGITFTSIAVGYNHVCALGSDGVAYCWGPDDYGQMGNGAATGSRTAPASVQMPAGVSFTGSIQSSGWFSCARGSGAASYCWGSDEYGKLGNGTATVADQDAPSAAQMPTGVSFTGIATGTADHMCAVGSREVYCWGHNDAGNVGDGTTISRASPVLVAGTR